MRKKLLSALLALVMVLSCLPVNAFAAAEPGEIISYVSFAYTHPPVMADDWYGEADTNFDALRNVFVVGLKTRVNDPKSDDAERENFTVEVKAGSAGTEGQYYKATEYRYSGKAASVLSGSGAIYFEAPKDVLKSGEKTYTVKITDTKANKTDEKDIKLVEIHLMTNGGQEFDSNEKFSASDKDGVITRTDGGFSIFAQQSKAVVFLPTLKNGAEGGGEEGQEFVGWTTEPNKNSGGTYISTGKDDATKDVYAVFGVKPVWDFVLMNQAPSGGSVPGSSETTFETKVDYGSAVGDEKAIKVYIVNTGNQPLGSATDSKKGFYAMSTSTEHFNISFDTVTAAGNAGTVTGNENKYWLGAGSNAGKSQGNITPADAPYIILKCTPKDNFPAGAYTDTLKIDNPLSRITVITLKLTVNKPSVTVDMHDITKEYGETVKLDDDGRWKDSAAPTISLSGSSSGASVPTFKELGLKLDNVGFSSGASVNSAGYPYINNGNSGNYDVTVNGTIKVDKATPTGGASINATAIKVGQSLKDSTLSGIFTNPYNDETVGGTLEWDEPDAGSKIEQEYPNGILKKWKFTPTDLEKYNVVSGESVSVIVTERTPTTIHRNTNEQYAETVTYDGNQHQAHVYVTYQNAEDVQTTLANAAVTYEYRLHQSDHSGADDTGDGWQSVTAYGWPKDAGTWDIRATYAGDTTYAPASQIFHLTIQPKEVSLVIGETITKTYDGKQTVDNVTLKVVGAEFIKDESLRIESCTATFDDANAGKNKTVAITDVKLAGNNAATKPENYKVPDVYHTTGTITPKSITIAVSEEAPPSKFYGEQYVFTTANFTATGLVDGDDLLSHVEFSSDGQDAGAKVGTYNITATVNSDNYILSGSSNVGTLKVEQSELQLNSDPTVTNGYKGGTKGSVQIIGGTVVNAHNPNMVVEGMWTLTDVTGNFDFYQETDTLKWKFEPQDTVNYKGTLEDTVTVNVLEKNAVKLTVKDSTAFTVTYDGNEHWLTADMFDVDPASAEISFVYLEDKTPKDAGSYTVMVTATPADEDAGTRSSATIEVTLEIKQAVLTPPELTFHGLEGTPLDQLNGLPTTMDGVNGEKIEGTFQWEQSDATVTEKDGASYTWFFSHNDNNYVNPVTGTAKVTMDEDTRKVSATVYNLPENDYAVVTVGSGDTGLKVGEKVVFYKDEACTDPVSSETEVPESVEKFTVNLDSDALTTESGTIYAKIVGKKTATTPTKYLPELGFTLPFDMVLLHVGGANADTSETVTVTPTDDSYTMIADAWTVSGDGANLVRVVDDKATVGSATFHAIAAGTTPITISITFEHPDPAKTGETIIVTKDLPLNITKHYVVFIESVENGTATATPTEVDAGKPVTVTLSAVSGYHASGLNVYKTGTDGNKDTEQPVNVSGSGSSYTFTMPGSDVVLVPVFDKDTSTGGGGSTGGSVGGGGSFGGGGFGGGTFVPPAPEAPTLKPEASADASGEAKAPVTSEEVESAVEEAKQNGAGEIVIEPQVTGSASKVSVELEKESVGAVAKESADLTVKTDAASVTLPDDSLAALAAGTGSSVTVSVEAKTGGAVDIEVAVDGKAVGSLSGGMKVELPKASGGNVLVIVGPDGSETIVKKSVVSGGSAYALLDGSCSVKVVNNAKNFADVAKTDWYSSAVDFAGSHELFNGVGENNFAPNTAMTRGMFATVLWRFESGEAVDTKSAFADVAEGNWYSDGVAWASEHKIINGYNPNQFAPEDNVTREQLATMLYRYAVDIGLDISAGGSLSKFSDAESVSAYAREALEWAVGAGLIQGNTTSTINPAGGAKRAEVATIFMRFCEMITK